MKIIMKLDAKPIKHRPYDLIPRVKEKVKREIDKMLAMGPIFLTDEVDWISPIVIQDRIHMISGSL